MRFNDYPKLKQKVAEFAAFQKAPHPMWPALQIEIERALLEAENRGYMKGHKEAEETAMATLKATANANELISKQFGI